MPKLLAHGLAAGLALVAVTAPIAVTALAAPRAPIAAPNPGSERLESPGSGLDCYEWSYPKKDSCGALGGTTECKSTATIESSSDETKRADCRPTKGDLCTCD